MSTPKVYVICDNNCKYESLTKEQILAAITQAIESGTVGDCDTGFITTVKTINELPLKFFVGRQYEYEALTEEQKTNLFAIITDDTTKEGMLAAITELQAFARNFKKSDFRGHNTGFSYQWLGQQTDRAKLDDITFEGHYFVIYGTNIPSGCSYGFLDVDYFDGTNFSPHGGSFEKVIKQTFRPWDTNDIYVRTYKSHEATWTDWECITKTKYMVYVELIVSGSCARFSFVSDTPIKEYTYAAVKAAFSKAFSARFEVPVTGSGQTDDGLSFLYRTAWVDNLNTLYFEILELQLWGTELNDVCLNSNRINVDESNPTVRKIKNVPLNR